jgi:hypothetical protein
MGEMGLFREFRGAGHAGWWMTRLRRREDGQVVLNAGQRSGTDFLVMDRQADESWWQYEAGRESAEDAATKQMPAERVAELTSLFQELDLF